MINLTWTIYSIFSLAPTSYPAFLLRWSILEIITQDETIKRSDLQLNYSHLIGKHQTTVRSRPNGFISRERTQSCSTIIYQGSRGTNVISSTWRRLWSDLVPREINIALQQRVMFALNRETPIGSAWFSHSRCACAYIS